jgi:hypothetical protein
VLRVDGRVLCVDLRLVGVELRVALGQGRAALAQRLLALLLALHLRLGHALQDLRLRRQQQRHRAPLHLGPQLDVRHVLALLHQPAELLLRHLGVRDLAAAEANREFHLVARLDEPPRSPALEREIVIVRLGAELDLLDVDDGLLPARLARLLRRLVLVLAEIEDLADGRGGLRIDLDQIQRLLLGHRERLVRRHDAEHRAVRADDAHLGHAYAVVDADLRSALVLSRINAGSSRSHSCFLPGRTGGHGGGARPRFRVGLVAPNLTGAHPLVPYAATATCPPWALREAVAPGHLTCPVGVAQASASRPGHGNKLIPSLGNAASFTTRSTNASSDIDPSSPFSCERGLTVRCSASLFPTTTR